jgi:hypothetical protein
MLDQDIVEYPPFTGRETFRFIIPDSSQITYGYYCKYIENSAYNPRYQVAFIEDRVVKNEKGIYLSRMKNQKGKYRYYLSEEHQTFYCKGCGQERCLSQGCRDGLDYEYYYNSKYVGKNVDKALLELFS